MRQARLKIEILAVTPDALSVIYAACRQCYSSAYAADIIKDRRVTDRKRKDFVKKIVLSGHESPLEHVTFTFAIKGVSRALTHQLVRHRIASYSQQSQRYVKESNFDFIIPPAIKRDADTKKRFIEIMSRIQEGYNVISNLLNKKGVESGKVAEDARFLLPQAIETKIVVSMNCRELIHFFNQRCCKRAQWEIQSLANRMLTICGKKLPEVFLGVGAKCEMLKYCPEGREFSCGKYPQNIDRRRI